MLTLDSLTAAPDLDRQQRRYNATDAAITLELQQRHMAAMTPAARSHFALLMRLHAPLLDMQLRGLRWHTSLARQLEAEAATEYWEAYSRLADAASVVPPVSDATLLPLLEPYCQKRLWLQVVAGTLGCVDAAKGTERGRVERVWTLVSQGYTNLPEAARGELIFQLGLTANPNTPAELCDLFYRPEASGGLGLPPQYNDVGNLTVDAKVLLPLVKKAKAGPQENAVRALLRLRHLFGRLKVLRCTTDADGRIRFGLSQVGTDTGRFACYKSSTGSGFNLQTLTKKLRRLVLADEDHELAEVDLEGADGWTVACWCAALGDPTMLDDLKAGIRPAKVVVLMLEHGEAVSRVERDRLREMCKDVSKDDWRYKACKRVQHGSSYGMGIPTMIAQIAEDAYKETGEPVFVEHALCKSLQRLFFLRYPGVKRWHAHVERLLRESGRMTSANGHTRTFYGRKTDIGTRNTALSEEPQQNTSHSISLALLNLWDNHRPLVTIMLQIHDALLMQHHASRKAEAVAAIRASFNNPLHIAGHELVIPFEGGIGTSWGELGEKL